MLRSGQYGGCLMGTAWRNIADWVLLPITYSCGEWSDKRRPSSLRRSPRASSSPD
jgi:hypothetical protein